MNADVVLWRCKYSYLFSSMTRQIPSYTMMTKGQRKTTSQTMLGWWLDWCTFGHGNPEAQNY